MELATETAEYVGEGVGDVVAVVAEQIRAMTRIEGIHELGHLGREAVIETVPLRQRY